MVTLHADLSAEHPVRPAGVSEDDRHDDQHAPQHEPLAVLGRGCLPDGDGPRHDVRPHADPQADHAQQEDRQRQQERLIEPALSQASR